MPTCPGVTEIKSQGPFLSRAKRCAYAGHDRVIVDVASLT